MKRKAIKRQREYKTKKSQKRKQQKKQKKQCPQPTNNSLTKHHIIPQSRGGNDDVIVNIRWGDHKAYHQLFGNMTPEEILEYLVEYFWNGDTQYIIDFYNQHIKGGVR